MKTILVTGASGFVGSALCRRLNDSGNKVLEVTRTKGFARYGMVINDISEFSRRSEESLGNVDVIVHLAGKAHLPNGRSRNNLEYLRRVNTEATVSLARRAVVSGVKRFIFISSIGVNGNVTDGKPFSICDVPQPHSPYALSKYEAELALLDISCSTGLEVVIIRSPLVYGPNAPGNFGALVRLLTLGIPLPFGAITTNKRSFISLENLVDFISFCINHPSAANQTFLVSDGEDVSTTDLLHRLALVMGKQVRLLAIAPSLLQATAKILGKGDMAQQLLGNLQVDITHACQTLGWKPPISVNEGLRRVVQELRNDPLV